MSKDASPKLDALRAMREAKFDGLRAVAPKPPPKKPAKPPPKKR